MEALVFREYFVVLWKCVTTIDSVTPYKLRRLPVLTFEMRPFIKDSA